MSAYRKQGEVPMYPKEETPEEKKTRLYLKKKKWNMFGIFVGTAFPCFALSGIGFMWNHMSSAFAATSCIAATIASIGVVCAIMEGLGGFDTSDK